MQGLRETYIEPERVGGVHRDAEGGEVRGRIRGDGLAVGWRSVRQIYEFRTGDTHKPESIGVALLATQGASNEESVAVWFFCMLYC